MSDLEELVLFPEDGVEVGAIEDRESFLASLSRLNDAIDAGESTREAYKQHLHELQVFLVKVDPDIVSEMLPEDVGKLTKALMSIADKAVIEAAKPKKGGRKKKATSNKDDAKRLADMLNKRDLADDF